MNPTRTRILAAGAVVVLALFAVAAVGVGPGPSPLSDSAAVDDADADGGDESADRRAYELAPADRPDDASTDGTVGYVEGYWYDDDLPVDERDDAAVDDDDLEPVVYRSMARVEVIRDRTFEDDVPVDVISREEFRNENDELFADVTGDERLQENVNYETLFMVDRETDAVDAAEGLYGGNVAGYYDPETDEIVLVSDSPETPEVNEAILGHELVHALQDQHFDLGRYDRETIDRDNAVNGLVEGDATLVETEYDTRCETEWTCLQPAGGAEQPPEPNWGLYLTIYHPYDDGPDYVEYLHERGGWDAVDDAYDEPPASSSEVIRPGEEREPADIAVPDRSSDDWQQLEVRGAAATETVGEAGMVAMFGGGALEPDEPTVIERSELLAADLGFDYDQPHTDGWAGDELVAYVSDEGLAANETDAAVEHTGAVWRSEWTSSEDSRQFAEAYLELLEGYGAEPVDDRRDTYVIEGDDYPGAYYLERSDDGQTVTIVRAPSVDALAAVEEGAAPEGEDTLEVNASSADGSSAGETDDGSGAGNDANETRDDREADDDELGDSTTPIVVGAIVVGTVVALAVARGRR